MFAWIWNLCSCCTTRLLLLFFKLRYLTFFNKGIRHLLLPLATIRTTCLGAFTSSFLVVLRPWNSKSWLAAPSPFGLSIVQILWLALFFCYLVWKTIVFPLWSQSPTSINKMNDYPNLQTLCTQITLSIASLCFLSIIGLWHLWSFSFLLVAVFDIGNLIRHGLFEMPIFLCRLKQHVIG